MFNIKKTPEDFELNEAISRVYTDMEAYSPDSDEYSRLTTQLDRLYSLRKSNDAKKVSADTKMIVAGNLATVAMIISFEKAHVLTSKAFSLLTKLK